MVNDLPFSEKTISEDGAVFLRIFKSEVFSDDLLWHWDDEDRTIKTLKKTDWLFQFDNELPIRIDREIKIRKGVWHRLIKGTGQLELIIEKHKDI